MPCTAIHVAVTLEHRLCLMCTCVPLRRARGQIAAISGDYPAMGLGWGARTAYIHEILVARALCTSSIRVYTQMQEITYFYVSPRPVT